MIVASFSAQEPIKLNWRTNGLESVAFEYRWVFRGEVHSNLHLSSSRSDLDRDDLIADCVAD
jgi:hypothetical protein